MKAMKKTQCDVNMQNLWRRATSRWKVKKIELLNDLLITLTPSSSDDAYPLDPPLDAQKPF